MSQGFITKARNSFHAALLKEKVLSVDKNGVPGNADKDSRPSREIASAILDKIGQQSQGSRLAGQMSGSKFEDICKEFIKDTFHELNHLRPGTWDIKKISARSRLVIAEYSQYTHLIALEEAARNNSQLSAALGNDYTITPDIIITREPEKDARINEPKLIVDSDNALLADLREFNNTPPILHASISCKWTMRSDRAQNARSEALNLVRNRKGRLPHIVVVTGEPTPSRIASIALGTGDIDCVYHFALPELREALKKLDFPDAKELLNTMIEGKRLKDIADLPLDLVI